MKQKEGMEIMKEIGNKIKWKWRERELGKIELNERIEKMVRGETEIEGEADNWKLMIKMSNCLWH